VLWIGFNADPDPAFYLNANPDPAFYLNADQDPGSQPNADPYGSGFLSEFITKKVFSMKIFLK
jgi:hypothetical protein